MSTQNPSAARDAAVFIDLENTLGISSLTNRDRYQKRIDVLVERLPLLLGKPEMTLDLWATAQTHRKRVRGEGTHYQKRMLSGERQQVTRETFKKYSGQVVFSKHKDADTVFIEEVRLRLKRKKLPRWVVFVTGDTGFRGVASEVSRAGHQTAVVVPRQMASPFWLTAVGRMLLYEDIFKPHQVIDAK